VSKPAHFERAPRRGACGPDQMLRPMVYLAVASTRGLAALLFTVGRRPPNLYTNCRVTRTTLASRCLCRR
jgi:hypothetical protein